MAPKRLLDRPRYPNGTIIYRQRKHPLVAVCACGQAKSERNPMCTACLTQPCACGRAKSYGAKQCNQCADTWRRATLQAQSFACEWCRCLVYGRECSARSGHGQRRFCSKRCWGAYLSAELAERSAQRQIKIAHEKAMRRAIQAARPCVHCGLPVSEGSHVACRKARAAAYIYARRDHPPEEQHLCPCCGAVFVARLRRRVYCSYRCGKHMRDYTLNLSVLPTRERNRVASIVTMLKQVRRVLNGGERWNRQTAGSRIEAPGG